jgi:hypothetical protein
VKKSPKSVAQPIVSQKLCIILTAENIASKLLASSVIDKKGTKINYLPMSKKSPNLVTLQTSHSLSPSDLFMTDLQPTHKRFSEKWFPCQRWLQLSGILI